MTDGTDLRSGLNEDDSCELCSWHESILDSSPTGLEERTIAVAVRPPKFLPELCTNLGLMVGGSVVGMYVSLFRDHPGWQYPSLISLCAIVTWMWPMEGERHTEKVKLWKCLLTESSGIFLGFAAVAHSARLTYYSVMASFIATVCFILGMRRWPSERVALLPESQAKAHGFPQCKRCHSYHPHGWVHYFDPGKFYVSDPRMLLCQWCDGVHPLYECPEAWTLYPCSGCGAYHPKDKPCFDPQEPQIEAPRST